jgi:hypothetical protein
MAGEDGVGKFFVVDPWRGFLDGRCKEDLCAAIPEARDVVADRPVRDAVAALVLVTESLALLQGQSFIGEGLDELENGGAFFVAGVRKALPVGIGHVSDLLWSGYRRFTAVARKSGCMTD